MQNDIGFNNRSDFTIDKSIFLEAMEAIGKVVSQHVEAVKSIREVSEQLIDSSAWKGKARDEFKDTYRIVEHYLDDDASEISSIGEILQGFQDIYEALDVETAKKLYDAFQQ